jgi:phosphate transport system permease protein
MNRTNARRTNARRTNARRAINGFWAVMMYLLTLLALVPLGLVLWFTVSKGLPPALHPEFFTNPFRPVGVPGAGVSNALVGTAILVGLASLMAIPIGILGGVYLAEYGVARWAAWVRLSCDVLVGTPSIAIGLFVYALVVLRTHHFSAIAGSVALGILMLPIVIRTTEGAVALIPNGMRESGLALGLPRWRVSLQLIVPAAAPGVITGALLAVARASGETAPLLFTSFGNTLFSVNPTHEIQALPLTVYQYALLPYPSLQEQAWGAALVLVVLVLGINLGSRWVLRRQIRLAGQL